MNRLKNLAACLILLFVFLFLTFTIISGNTSVIPNDSLKIVYLGGLTAELSYTPIKIGLTKIELLVTDDGGSSTNNGNSSKKIEFEKSKSTFGELGTQFTSFPRY